MHTRMALSNASRVMICDGRISLSASSTILRPLVSAMARRRASLASRVDVPGSIMPSASETAAMVDAVPITLHAPAEQDMHSSSSCQSLSEILPVRYWSQYFHMSVPLPISTPRHVVELLGPPLTWMVGRFVLAAPMSCAGPVLSQLDSSTTASIGFARRVSSTSMAIRLRYSIAVGFMNSSPSEMVGNSSGRPPAARTPRLTASATSRRFMLQLFNSLHEFAMPITGRSLYRSGSKPIDRSAARCWKPSSSRP